MCCSTIGDTLLLEHVLELDERAGNFDECAVVKLVHLTKTVIVSLYDCPLDITQISYAEVIEVEYSSQLDCGFDYEQKIRLGK